MSWKNNTCQYTAFTVFFTSSWVSVLTLGPFHIYITNSLCENLNYYLWIQTFCVLLPHFSSNSSWGTYDWLFGGWVVGEGGGGLTLNQRKSLLVSCGGLQVHLWSSEMVVSSQTRENEWMKSDPHSLGPKRCDPLLCAVCYRLACTVYLPCPSLPLASLIVPHRRLVSCSEPLVLNPFVCLSSGHFSTTLIVCSYMLLCVTVSTKRSRFDQLSPFR